MKKIAVIGGGTGLSVILRGLKQIEDVQISAIVTVADDGGSTGRLRRQFHIPAMGDIRNVMVALSEEETLFSHLMNYRFDGEDQDVGGHNLGNLILTALCEEQGNFMDAIQTISKVLNVKGEIIPATTQVITLFAHMSDGTIVRGESNIPDFDNQISEVFYDEEVVATTQAVNAILEADYILIGIGSLYTSVIPNLIIRGISDALKESHGKRIYFCNAMNQPGETDNYTLEDHITAIEKHSFKGIIETVVAYNDEISEETLQKYDLKGSTPVKTSDKHHDYHVITANLLNFEGKLIRHDSNKIRDIMIKIMKDG